MDAKELAEAFERLMESNTIPAIEDVGRLAFRNYQQIAASLRDNSRLAAEVAELRKQIDRLQEIQRVAKHYEEFQWKIACISNPDRCGKSALLFLQDDANELVELRKQLEAAKGRAVAMDDAAREVDELADFAADSRGLRISQTDIVRRLNGLHDALAAPAATEPADKTCRTCLGWHASEQTRPTAIACWCVVNKEHRNYGDSCDKHEEVRP
jgi:hypothetical protein